jgi:hypothetical protein
MSAVRRWWSVVTAVVVRPDLWRALVALGARLVPGRPWRNGVLPPREYRLCRGNAIYGMPLSRIPARDFIRYLEWCKAFPSPIE